MTRCVHVVAYDIGSSSPAQPRIASVLRELVRRNVAVRLHTECHPGSWALDLTSGGLLSIQVVNDPVRSVSRVLRGDRGPRAVSKAARAPGFLWRVGFRAQSHLLFPDPESMWSRRVASRVARMVRVGDLVLTCARPESVGHVGERARARGARWWFDFADGWCFQGLRREAMAPGRRRDRERELERRWVGAADVVSTVDDELATAFAAHRRGGDVTVFPNIVPDELVSAPRARIAPARDLLTLGYFGRLSGSDGERSLRPVLDVLRAQADPCVRFVFHGDYLARDLEELQALRALGPEVEVRPPLPRDQLAARRAEFDAALVIGSPGQRGSSSKLLDVLGLDLPTVAFVAVSSIAERVIREAGCGEAIALGGSADAVPTWHRFLSGVRRGVYRVDPIVRDRYTSAAFVPGLVDRMLDLLGAPISHP